MTADQPLSENSTAWGEVGGGLIVIRYSNTCSKSCRTLTLNSEGMLRGTDNFYFILITFSFKLELVLINRVIYALLHGMNTIVRMFVLNHFCCPQECMQNHCFIQSLL